LKKKSFNALCEYRLGKLKKLIALSHHQKILKKKTIHAIRFFTKIVMPEDRAMSVALKQHQILVKIQVLRELKFYTDKKKRAAKIVDLISSRLNLTKMGKVFNQIVNYAAKSAIKKSLLQRSIEQRRVFLIRTVLMGLKQNVRF
jgi:hypothetical protein